MREERGDSCSGTTLFHCSVLPQRVLASTIPPLLYSSCRDVGEYRETGPCQNLHSIRCAGQRSTSVMNCKPRKTPPIVPCKKTGGLPGSRTMRHSHSRANRDTCPY